ncbi:MAG: hypothetical protein ACKPKO_60665, partial [Candidatus Fonsibacter sp.]
MVTMGTLDDRLDEFEQFGVVAQRNEVRLSAYEASLQRIDDMTTKMGALQVAANDIDSLQERCK